MMKRPYCCDESREVYEQYYDRRQSGKGEFPVYVGRFTQRVQGIGNINGSLFRRILPALKTVVPHVLRTGANVLEDVAEGKSFNESAIKGFRKAFAALKEATITRIPEGFGGQSGSGKRKRRKQDIFD
jgi:hypothetical protein